MATKDHRLQAKVLIEQLESRLHSGPPIDDTEILSVSDFLQQKEFSAASDYHVRLRKVRDQLSVRSKQSVPRQIKRNYGGEAGGRWMQVQSAYDHIILSTCYAGQFNTQRGRIKISHRFNIEGRIDFVELKFISALQPFLNGQFRKLLLVNGFQSVRKDWNVAEAFVLPVLPRELLFLYEQLFRCPKHELFAWLVNVGHGLVQDLVTGLQTSNKSTAADPSEQSGQLPLELIQTDDVASPILAAIASLKCTVQCLEPKLVLVRY